ncbi:glycoside hydrolase family 5 protein [Streptomyces sp. NPDC002787]
MQPGWNLGNTYDAIPDETSWGNPPVTRELLKKVKSQGFRSIRLPVTRSIHQGPGPDYTIDPAWLAKVRRVADLALDEGLYVLLNMHHDSLRLCPTAATRPSIVTPPSSLPFKRCWRAPIGR